MACLKPIIRDFQLEITPFFLSCLSKGVFSQASVELCGCRDNAILGTVRTNDTLSCSPPKKRRILPPFIPLISYLLIQCDRSTPCHVLET
uniref:Uncharacterized protein n=1 Tax=Apteryx owenii TaxID=8824 RepID=A0A8B9P9C5_APTOW